MDALTHEQLVAVARVLVSADMDGNGEAERDLWAEATRELGMTEGAAIEAHGDDGYSSHAAEGIREAKGEG